jgi:hypothetical protein
MSSTSLSMMIYLVMTLSKQDRVSCKHFFRIPMYYEPHHVNFLTPNTGHGDEVVRNPLTFESFGNEYSHDDGFDFVSDNGSGFDTFASSDDGSRSTGAGFGKSASDIALMKSVMKSKDAPYFSEKSRSDQFMNDLSLDFTTFGLNDTEGEQGEVRTKRKKSGRKNTYETSEI